MEWRDAIAAITGDSALWEWPISEACSKCDVSTSERVNMFLATCAHESDGFKRLVENLNYGPSGLLAAWPKRFTPAEAVEFAHDAIRIAERAYGGRMGNGAEGTGDGYRYRGRGLIQLTGRNAYRAASVIGQPFEDEPDSVAEVKWAAYTAADFWRRSGCNELADAGKFQSIVLRVNGGLIGMDSRLAWLDRVRTALA